jgi:hypothetical protein
LRASRQGAVRIVPRTRGKGSNDHRDITVTQSSPNVCRLPFSPATGKDSLEFFRQDEPRSDLDQIRIENTRLICLE